MRRLSKLKPHEAAKSADRIEFGLLGLLHVNQSFLRRGSSGTHVAPFTFPPAQIGVNVCVGTLNGDAKSMPLFPYPSARSLSLFCRSECDSPFRCRLSPSSNAAPSTLLRSRNSATWASGRSDRTCSRNGMPVSSMSRNTLAGKPIRSRVLGELRHSASQAAVKTKPT